MPENANKPYDMRELIVKVADDGDFFELQPDYAKNILIGFKKQGVVLTRCLHQWHWRLSSL